MRCWKCKACKVVQGTKQITLAKIASYDATTTWETRDNTVREWNKCLADNPCENLEKENEEIRNQTY